MSMANEVQEPQWLDMTTFDRQGYEVQLDARAEPGSEWEWRHRPAVHTGENLFEWHPGQPPKPY